MLGILAVSLLARPADEMDAIRQTITYSLFASSVVVVIAAVLLAATNLPKEIESRAFPGNGERIFDICAVRFGNVLIADIRSIHGQTRGNGYKGFPQVF